MLLLAVRWAVNYYALHFPPHHPPRRAPPPFFFLASSHPSGFSFVFSASGSCRDLRGSRFPCIDASTGTIVLTLGHRRPTLPITPKHDSGSRVTLKVYWRSMNYRWKMAFAIERTAHYGSCASRFVPSRPQTELNTNADTNLQSDWRTRHYGIDDTSYAWTLYTKEFLPRFCH